MRTSPEQDARRPAELPPDVLQKGQELATAVQLAELPPFDPPLRKLIQAQTNNQS